MTPNEHAEHAIQDLLAADTVLPEQFWHLGEGISELSGERALMWAVFTDGIECFRRNAHATSIQHRAEFAEAECWVFTTDWDWPFSFVNLCEMFGLNPFAVRHSLRAWRRRTGPSAVRRQRFRPVTLHAA